MKNAKLTALIAILFLTCGFADDGNAPIRAEDYKAAIKVACVGDSITAGVGTKKAATDSYPAQLGRMLGEKWEVRNFGVSGATMLRKGDHPYSPKNALAFNPDVVVIMLGTNDTKPHNWEHKGEFSGDYSNMIEQFAKLPSKPRIFICYPPFVSKKGAFGINGAGLAEQIPMIEKLAKEMKVGLIDVFGALKGKDGLLPDTVHPNTDGATVIGKTVFKALAGKEFEGDVPAPVEKSPKEPTTKPK